MPAAIRFHCPACGLSVSAAPQYAGLPGPCPGCRATVTVPAPPSPNALAALAKELKVTADNQEETICLGPAAPPVR